MGRCCFHNFVLLPANAQPAAKSRQLFSGSLKATVDATAGVLHIGVRAAAGQTASNASSTTPKPLDAGRQSRVGGRLAFRLRRSYDVITVITDEHGYAKNFPDR
jgi:hypothetical protein